MFGFLLLRNLTQKIHKIFLKPLDNTVYGGIIKLAIKESEC